MLDKIKKMITKEKEPKQKEETVEEIDTSYLTYSAEAVGYDNRENQWNIYRTVMTYIPENSSILDFGCGRGDLHAFSLSEYEEELDYFGVDMNEPLIKAGKEIYPKIADDLYLGDWFKLPKGVSKDWCVNIGSNNLRYDADIKKDDFEYLCKTIDAMYERANVGIVLLLTSGPFTNGLISHDPGRLLNWCQRKYGNVVLDHAVSKTGFCLIINK